MENEKKQPIMQFDLEIAGDSAVNLVVAGEISDAASNAVAQLANAIDALRMPGITDIVPTYCSVMVCYNPVILSLPELQNAVEGLKDATTCTFSPGKTMEIPVAYGGAFGPDLEDVAALSGLSASEVIAIHSGTDYPIAMLGFMPGFPYLSGLDTRIHTPRLDTPRTRIPRGSVGIGGAQTGIYPFESPGGWRLIGRTPLPLFDPSGEHAIPYAAGDKIRFVPISEETFYQIEARYNRNGASADNGKTTSDGTKENSRGNIAAPKAHSEFEAETIGREQSKRLPLAQASYTFGKAPRKARP